ncbi:pyridoxamine 5'-phosphate oxidase family protein [Nocardiopsis ansamitocini]|uniref:Pyridoxamine 5'-phosphate oxidase n=1 Tax=Nocardiopsis ansamitocini TaxID=1670832 RepID=A0A9W6P4V2_9ACTN|nr:pyridoxamine 5'-phosphate oxidase family protein [Nocardiopsis ansamitocini]GLU47128.1 pyridoxamine 5'-phosphate oxidase [Nocardiopsis ansamitocini]
MRIDTAGLEILRRAECLRLLAAAPIGRIVFTDRALPAIQPVNFTLHGADIIVRTAPDTKLAQATRDSVVAFEVDDYDVYERTGWSVTVVGIGRAVTDLAELAELRTLPLRAWAPGDRAHYIRIETDIVTGRRIPG